MSQNSEQGSTADAVAETVKQKTDEAKAKVEDAAAAAEDEATGQAATQQQRVADGLRTAGEKVGALADGDGVVSDLAEKASAGLAQASSWVSQRDPEAMLTEAKSFARRKPWLVAGGAVLAFLLANRVTHALTGKGKNKGKGKKR